MVKKLNESFKEKINKPLLYSTFILFLITLIWFVMFKCVGVVEIICIRYTAETIPKLNIYERFMYQFRYGFFNQWKMPSFEDNIENIIIFLPFGLFLPIINNKKYLYNLLITFLICLGIETTQIFFGLGNFELSDLISNPMGYSIGYLIYLMIKRFLTPQVINYICLTVFILFLPLTIYGYTSLIINYEIFKPFFSATNFRNLFNI